MKKILLIIGVLAVFGVGWRVSKRLGEQAPKAPAVYQAGEYHAGEYHETLGVGSRERSYLLYVPNGFKRRKPYPLLLGFHGGGGDGAKFARQTGLSDYADREGFIAVYPDGIEHNWNDGRDTTDAYKAGADDVKFMRLLVENLKKKLPIDGQRIYAAGVSNGGFFTQRLGCEAADVFAAVGTVSASMPTKLVEHCFPTAPISVVVIQGTADPVIPIGGGIITGFGDGGMVESAENTLRLWADKNECLAPRFRESLAPRVSDGTRVEKIEYASCSGGVKVVYYIVSGMGHGWPPKKPQAPRLAGPTSNNIDATEVIWGFFKTHPKQ